MAIDIKIEQQRLSQTKFLEWMTRLIRASEMVTVYLSEDSDNRNIGLYSCLVPNTKLDISLNNLSWDLNLGGGHPGAVVHYEGGKEIVEYLRYGERWGVEPLVIYRQFHGIRNNYLEISEEFRLFHNLYHDLKQNRLIKIDDSGTEHLIAIIKPKRIEIRLQEIQQFLAIKEMHLAVMFDARENSTVPLADLQLKEGAGEERREGLLAYKLHYGDLHFGGTRAFTRLLGKRLFPPFPKEKSGFWGFAAEEKKKCIEFIIDIDEHGTEITNYSDPDGLDNNFGSNPGKPHYLTPVYFRKEVLNKYYNQPSKYSVEDGYLRCAGLWGMQMDNHHDDIVAAWLGDLGRDLPYEEQLHWRGYNIAPSGGVSKTFYKRQIMAQFADSEHPDHVFKYRYEALAKSCLEELGWQLLLPLSKEDAHFLAAIRVPATDEQKDFDNLILALTKVLVDSLNEKELNKLIPPSEAGSIKGSISRLEKAIISVGVEGAADYIKFLRNLQNLRSSGAAHRKGSNYRKVAEEMGTESQSLRSVFQGIMEKAILFLEFLESFVITLKATRGRLDS